MAPRTQEVMQVCEDVPQSRPTAKRMKIENASLPDVIKERGKAGAVGMQVYHLNPFIVMTQFKGENLLDVVLKVCDR